MLTVFSGVTTRGFQFASGDAVGRSFNPSPYSDSVLKLQIPYFLEAGIDLNKIMPNFRLGTINVELGKKVILNSSDYCAPLVGWTKDEPGPPSDFAPETFSFVHCCFVFEGKYHPALIYYPHPETKPSVNRHHFDILEVLTYNIPGIQPGLRADIVCRSDAFVPF